jgi:hypothetical protein
MVPKMWSMIEKCFSDIHPKSLLPKYHLMSDLILFLFILHGTILPMELSTLNPSCKVSCVLHLVVPWRVSHYKHVWELSCKWGKTSYFSPTPIATPCFLMHSFQTSSTSPFGSRWVKCYKGDPISLCLSFLGVGRFNMQAVMFHFWTLFGDRFGSPIHNNIWNYMNLI